MTENILMTEKVNFYYQFILAIALGLFLISMQKIKEIFHNYSENILKLNEHVHIKMPRVYGCLMILLNLVMF